MRTVHVVLNLASLIGLLLEKAPEGISSTVCGGKVIGGNPKYIDLMGQQELRHLQK